MNEKIARDPVSLFKALSEELRLRILCILEEAEFSVVELMEALDAPQSTISRHLACLRKAGLAQTRREGTLVYYSRGPALDDGLGETIGPLIRSLPRNADDRRAAQRIIERRRRASQDYFDAMARRYSDLAEPGGAWRALAGALALGFDGRVVADIGAGEGDLALRLAQSARTVFAIDHSREMVRLLRERARATPGLIVKEGDLEALPLEDGACDVAIVSQALHHCPRPRVALGEAWRVLRPGGRLILLDLEAHAQEWTRDRLGDHWLGFEPRELRGWLEAAGFADLKVFSDPSPQDDLKVLTVTGLRP